MRKMNEAGVKKGGVPVLKIPARVESATLAKFFKPGEPAVVLKLLGVGNTAPFYLQDKAARILVLKWDSRAGGHVIRIPHSLWHAHEARLAHDVMETGRLVNAMIVTFELPEAVGGEGVGTVAMTATASSAAPAAMTVVDAEAAAVVVDGDDGPGAMSEAAGTSSSFSPGGRVRGAVAGEAGALSSPDEMGATDQGDAVRIVVGPDPGRPAVAPTSAGRRRGSGRGGQ